MLVSRTSFRSFLGAPLSVVLAVSFALLLGPVSVAGLQQKKKPNKKKPQQQETVVPSSASSPNEDALRLASRRLDVWDLEGAQSALDAAPDKESAAYLTGIGRLLAQRGELQEASQRMEAAIQRADATAETWNWAGEVRLWQKREEPANQAFRRAVELAEAQTAANPQSGRSWLELGAARQRLAQYGPAFEALERARTLLEDDVEVLYQIGRAQLLSGNSAAADEALTRALGKESGLAYAYFYRGLAVGNLDRKSQMINDLDRFVRIAPTAPEAERVRRIVASASR